MKKITFIVFVLFAGLITAQDFNYTIKNIDVNTKYSDFGVTYYGDSLAIYASSKNKKAVRPSLWKDNMQPYLELYRGNVTEEGEIEGSKKLSKEVNTKYHESNVAFTKDLKTVYFSRNNYLDKKFVRDTTGMNLIQMYKAQVNEDGHWDSIVAMPFNSRNYQTGHPVLNKEETKLYFTSDMPGSLGSTDIFVVDVNQDGTYGEPKNLGSNVNTVGKEMFPFIDDNDVLYFSSNGYITGRTDLDIYAVNLLDTSNKYAPINLGAPLNSLGDDFNLVFQSGKRSGHFSSNRKGGKGDDDIYYFIENNPLKFGCDQIANGVVRVKGTNELLPGARVDLFDAQGKLLESTIADAEAKFSFKVDCSSYYKVVGSKKGYEIDATQFTSTEEADLKLDLGLNLGTLKEFVSQRDQLMININMIYFDLDKSYIRPDAAIELEKVIRVMKKYPLINIILGSHTDSRSSHAYNEALSERRATSSKAWLVNRGISSSRITARAYGETQLVNQCADGVKCSEAEHQLNRRTEFVIANPEVVD